MKVSTISFEVSEKWCIGCPIEEAANTYYCSRYKTELNNIRGTSIRCESCLSEFQPKEKV